MPTASRLLCASALLLALTACGGGGGGSAATTGPSSGGTSAGDVPTPSSAHSLQLQVPAAVYAVDVGGEEIAAMRLAVWNHLNQVRQGMGLGLLRQHAALDRAAQGHAQYLAAGSADDTGGISHIQVPGRPGFTGVQPQERAEAAGYTGLVSEVIAYVGDTGEVDMRQRCIHALMRSPSHADILTSGAREVGVGVARRPAPPENPALVRYLCVLKLSYGRDAQPQLPAPASAAAVYPFHGMTEAPTRGNFINGQVLGPYVLARLDAYGLSNRRFAVERFVLRETSGREVEAVLQVQPDVATAAVLQRQAPPTYISNGLLLLQPLQPLLHGHTYQVEFVGRVDGVLRTFSGSFTTTTDLSR